jgi:hypothetical protein
MLVKSKFDGIGIDYDQSKNPWFEVVVNEALGKLAEKPLGKRLLEKIGAASPPGTAAYNVAIYSAAGARGEGEAEFIDHRYISDRTSMTLKEGCENDDTLKLDKKGGVGSVASPSNVMDAENGKGTKVRLRFNDKDIYVQKADGKNVMIPAFIVLGHELIHAYHSLKGIKKPRNQEVTIDGKKIVAEEAWTTGLGDLANGDFSENKLRKEWGFPPRDSYP